MESLQLSEQTMNYLLSLDNVVGIGYGLKEINGCLTSQPAIIVMVLTKMQESELAADQIIPKQVDGLISDVIAVGKITVS